MGFYPYYIKAITFKSGSMPSNTQIIQDILVISVCYLHSGVVSHPTNIVPTDPPSGGYVVLFQSNKI